MNPTCTCRATVTMVGSPAIAYSFRFLREMSPGDGSVRLLACRVCGAYWELQEEGLGDEESRRVRLRRVRSASAVEDWRMYESEDRD